MSRVIEYVKRLVRREPVMVRTALGMAVSFVIVTLHLPPAWNGAALVVVWSLVATWARARVTPYERP